MLKRRVKRKPDVGDTGGRTKFWNPLCQYTQQALKVESSFK